MFALFNSNQRSNKQDAIGLKDEYRLASPKDIQNGVASGKVDTLYLSSVSIPNTYDEVHCDLIVEEPGPAVTVTLQLRGYFSFTRFATYLADALNASALTGVYTVVFAPAPYAQYTITSTVPFRFDLTRPANDPSPLEDPSVHLGLERIVTPTGLSITSTKPVIITVNQYVLIRIHGLEEGQPTNEYGNTFTYCVQVNCDKDEVITFGGRRYTQIVNFTPDYFISKNNFRVSIARSDGGQLYNLADYNLLLEFALSSRFAN